MDSVIAKALHEAESLGIKGKDTTPFLLAKVKELTKGESLRANIALVENNAKIGARIAVDLKARARLYSTRATSAHSTKRPFIMGGAVLDITCTSSVARSDMLNTSTIGTVAQVPGGVGRNIVHACVLASTADSAPLFFTLLGTDAAAQTLEDQLKSLGLELSLVQRVPGAGSAVYSAIFEKSGELVAAVADMAVLETPFALDLASLSRTSVVAFDGNLHMPSVDSVAQYARSKQLAVLFEPTSLHKCLRVFDGDLWKKVDFVTPDRAEARCMAQYIAAHGLGTELGILTIAPTLDTASFAPELEWMQTLLSVFPNVLLKCGSRGVLVGTRRSGTRNCTLGKRNQDSTTVSHVAPTRPVSVVNVSGAGDSMVGVLLAGLAQRVFPTYIGHGDLLGLVQSGVKAAEMTVESDGISALISPSLLC
ncbi:hypothetical protein HDU91_001844 [Kappamyces sp. JEL0680]|nr:hypothetical protein HDU91_001844 [Kappamyces sp. JEL0680]